MNSRRLRITDRKDGILSFDLKQVLNIIGPVCEGYSWFIYFLETEKLTGNKERVFELLSQINDNTEEKSSVSWNDVLLISDSIFQTIDLEMGGAGDDRFITIRAVDTSYWEIETTNELAYQKILGSFEDIEIL